jgi:hypothetical protein
MFQRIQTIYIILFAILLFVASFMPFASVDVTDKSIYTLVPTGWESTEDSQVKSPFFVGYLVAISFAVLMLVNFKKRKKTIKIWEDMLLNYYFNNGVHVQFSK